MARAFSFTVGTNQPESDGGAPPMGKRLFRLDDDYRIEVTLPVIFCGRVRRIE